VNTKPLQQFRDTVYQALPKRADATMDLAETLPERIHLKSQTEQVAQVGEKFSWLARLVKTGTSWVAPQDVQRVRITLTDSAVPDVSLAFCP
jgi:hypothetical protein